MNTYKVFFELYGKKMCTTVEATDRGSAEQVIMDNIIIHEVRLTDGKEPDYGSAQDDQSLKDLMDMLGMK